MQLPHATWLVISIEPDSAVNSIDSNFVVNFAVNYTEPNSIVNFVVNSTVDFAVSYFDGVHGKVDEIVCVGVVLEAVHDVGCLRAIVQRVTSDT